MKRMHVPLVIGNWKMNPLTITRAKELATDLKKSLARVNGVSVVVVPPSIFIPKVSEVRAGKSVYALGAQNAHHEKLGPHTGEISLPMLAQYDVSYVIIGHSERRRDGETDAQIHTKLEAIMKASMTPVLCVGESERDTGGNYFSHIESQITSALAGLPKAKLSQVVIAYEPIWAIGTGKVATAEDVHEMQLFIHKTLTNLYGRAYAAKVRILYGGSVNAKVTEALFRDGQIDGFLVGGASLEADEFTEIVRITARVCAA